MTKLRTLEKEGLNDIIDGYYLFFGYMWTLVVGIKCDLTLKGTKVDGRGPYAAP